jgi:hypothetical protein
MLQLSWNTSNQGIWAPVFLWPPSLFIVPLHPPPGLSLHHLVEMPSAIKKPQTLYDKVFQTHIVDERDDGTILLYIGEYLPEPAGDETGLIALQIDISSTKSHRQ